MTNVFHLTASTFFGGPEHQMLGLASNLPEGYRTFFCSFRERGRCQEFLDRTRAHGFTSWVLDHDTPSLVKATSELIALLRESRADILCTHGYKSDLIGLAAVKRLGIPIVAVSHGWTRETMRVRLYETLDRCCLRWMDRVVCVSEGQAAKVLRAGVPSNRAVVIRDAIESARFSQPDPLYADQLRQFFNGTSARIVGAAGRLSPEKGFADLVDAAKIVTKANAAVRFVLFGDGRLRHELEQRIAASSLESSFVLTGFRTDLDRFLPHLDLLVQSSYTEGLPNIVLEAFAGGVPVVATAVGGTPEVIVDGASGYLVPPGNPSALAERILDILGNEERRRAMGQHGRNRVLNEFSFQDQGERYARLFQLLGVVPAWLPAGSTLSGKPTAQET